MGLTIKTPTGFNYIENALPMPVVAVPAPNVAPPFYFSWSDVSQSNPVPVQIVGS